MIWDGVTERRKNTVNGEQIIQKFDARLTTLETRFIERWISHDVRAEERQNITCKKLDDIKLSIGKLNDEFVSLDKTTVLMVNTVNERITKLPCEKRAGLYNQVKVMWGLLVLIIGAIVGEWIRKR